ncbi:MAG: hypothetical protein ACXVVU_24705 [Solirubrobacteraceae bacterium]
MLAPTLQLVVAPGLVGASTLAARRWGLGLGGLVSAFPAIVGPLLLIAAEEHGTAVAAKAASGTLLGLVALSGFALAYGRTALHAGWATSLAAGWATAAGIAVLLAGVDAGPLAGLGAATLSLVVAYCALPRGGAPLAARSAPRWDLPLRMAVAAALVAALAAAATRLGPLVGGILAALPVLASVLAVFTHEQNGAAAGCALLRGMLGGMAGFVVFCLLVALLVDRAGVPATFVAAALAAVAVQAATARTGAAPHDATGVEG